MVIEHTLINSIRVHIVLIACFNQEGLPYCWIARVVNSLEHDGGSTLYLYLKSLKNIYIHYFLLTYLSLPA